MKKYYLFCLICFSCGNAAFAQLDTFDLSHYAYADFVRHQLDVNVQMRNNGAWSRQVDNGQRLTDGYQGLLRGNFSAFYTLLRNTRQRQQALSVYVSGSPALGNTTNSNPSLRKYATLNGRATVSSENRWYDTRQRFVEMDVISSGFANSQRETFDSQVSIGQHYDVTVQVPLKVGKGRIERVDDARMAVFILEALQQEQRLSRTPEEADILAFSALISRLRNQRFFDFRHKKIYELEMLDQFLQDRKLTDSPDTRYFTTLSDNWNFAINPYRQVGNRFSVGIAPELHVSHQIDRVESATFPDQVRRLQDHRFGLSVSTAYLSEKPINLYWQRTFFGELAYHRTGNAPIFSGQTGTIFPDSRVSGTFRYGWVWHPSSRTILQATSQIQGRLLLPDEQAGFTSAIPDWNLNAGLNTLVNYYIAPQIRLAVQFNVGYAYTRREVDPMNAFGYFREVQGLNHALDAGLLYSFL